MSGTVSHVPTAGSAYVPWSVTVGTPTDGWNLVSKALTKLRAKKIHNSRLRPDYDPTI